MTDVNKVLLEGVVGKIKRNGSTGNTDVFTISLATNHTKTADSTTRFTSCHVVFFRAYAQQARESIEAGDRVSLSGHLHYSNYEVDGVKKKSTSVIADSFHVVGKSKRAAEVRRMEANGFIDTGPKMVPLDDDDIPF